MNERTSGQNSKGRTKLVSGETQTIYINNSVTSVHIDQKWTQGSSGLMLDFVFTMEKVD